MNQKGLAPILIVILLAAALMGGYSVYSDKIGVYQKQTKPTPSPQPTTQPSPSPTGSVEEKFCGGLAANLPENQCPPGYTCKLDGNYPDASGKCVKD